MKKQSQIDLVAQWLLKGRNITPLQALEKFGCFRLGAVIWELNRPRNYDGLIQSKLVKVKTKHGRGYAYVSQYWLED
jgi:hypothetical protein